MSSDKARAASCLALCAAAALLSACDPAPALVVDGAIERDAVTGRDATPVPLAYGSHDARGEWWPCELRVTAAGCVGTHHVNVYVALPGARSLDDLARTGCVAGGVASGVFELLDSSTQRTFRIGADVEVFALVASDAGGKPGARLDDDKETAAATRLASGTLAVQRFTGLGGAIAYTIEGQTPGGHALHVDFDGPTTNPRVVATLDPPSSCVDRALFAR